MAGMMFTHHHITRRMAKYGAYQMCLKWMYYQENVIFFVLNQENY